MRLSIFRRTKAAVNGWLFVLLLSATSLAQQPVTTSAGTATAPQRPPSSVVVKLVDEIAFKKLIVPNGKPLLINFWATWCDPCREEFPDLVKLDNEYKGKIDFITVSLDDPEDIGVAVPKFLASLKAEMPAYLLKTADESAVISSVSKDWQGGMPFTILLTAKGETAHFRQGKINPETVRAEINKLVAAPTPAANELFVMMDFVKIKDGKRDEALFFYDNNWKVYREAAIKRGVIHSYELIDAKSKTDAAFDLILITRYKGEEQFRNSERNFEPILKELRPNGPSLLNALKPSYFRDNVFLYEGKRLATSDR
ncbi:MAG: TlpA disulfide reductase family protein [Pyrinomonadaceae bacterium]